jgi:hypothetical protein
MFIMGEPVAIRLSSPSCSVIFGATSCGKSHLTKRILQHCNDIYDKPVNKILYCYTVFQPLFETMEKEMPNLTFHKGAPSEQYIDEFVSGGGHNVCVLDDMQSVVASSPEMEQLFTIWSHHKSVSVLLILQNLYVSGKYARSLALQAHYLWAMKSLRDQTQLAYLSRQIYPGKSRLIPEVFADVMKMDKYPYLMIDLAPQSDDRFRLRTHIFPGEDVIFYQSKP